MKIGDEYYAYVYTEEDGSRHIRYGWTIGPLIHPNKEKLIEMSASQLEDYHNPSFGTPVYPEITKIKILELPCT